MSEKTQDVSGRTGEISKLEVREALARREPPRPAQLPEEKPDAGSTTGIIPIAPEQTDLTARRESDKPAPSQ